jgi:hypothetical protein
MFYVAPLAPWLPQVFRRLRRFLTNHAPLMLFFCLYSPRHSQKMSVNSRNKLLSHPSHAAPKHFQRLSIVSMIIRCRHIIGLDDLHGAYLTCT